MICTNFKFIFWDNDKYWVDDGCYSKFTSGDFEDYIPSGDFQDSISYTNVKGVRCCSLERNINTTCSTPRACTTGQNYTFSEAKSICEEQDKRLCTREELRNEICCKSGGSCDDYPIWTSTKQNREYPCKWC